MYYLVVLSHGVGLLTESHFRDFLAVSFALCCVEGMDLLK